MNAFLKNEGDGEGMGAAKTVDGEAPAPEGKMWKRTKVQKMEVDAKGYMVTSEEWKMELVDAPKSTAASPGKTHGKGQKRPSPTKDGDEGGGKAQKNKGASPSKAKSKAKKSAAAKQTGIASFFGKPKKKA